MTDWPDVLSRVFVAVLGASVTAFQLFVFYKIWRWWAYERPGIHRPRGGPPSPKVLLRRLYCRHHHVARDRDQYGKHTTLCVQCGTDVNAGKPREEWR